MSRLIRQFCTGFAVTIMVMVQCYGVANAGHRIEHALQFPGVSYEDAAVAAHDHHDDHEHDHADEAPGASDDAAIADSDAKEPNGAPLQHHHHSGGDVHVALIPLAQPIQAADRGAARPGPRPSAVPPGADSDGPLDPPKQNV